MPGFSHSGDINIGGVSEGGFYGDKGTYTSANYMIENIVRLLGMHHREKLISLLELVKIIFCLPIFFLGGGGGGQLNFNGTNEI